MTDMELSAIREMMSEQFKELREVQREEAKETREEFRRVWNNGLRVHDQRIANLEAWKATQGQQQPKRSISEWPTWKMMLFGVGLFILGLSGVDTAIELVKKAIQLVTG